MRGFNSDEVLNRAVRGTVRAMRDGNIRWSFVSSFCVRLEQATLRYSLSPVPPKSRFRFITMTTSGGS
jgi:hypothetical protein